MFPLLMLCAAFSELSEATDLVKALKDGRFRNADLRDGSEDLRELSNLIEKSEIDADELRSAALRYAANKTFTGGNAKAICERLLEKGANVNTRDWLGTTPLMQSAHQGDRDLTEFLLRRGANPYRLNADDNTALDCALYNSLRFVGLVFNKTKSVWIAMRWSKHEKKIVYNGSYIDEVQAAQASDTLARCLMRNGDEKHNINFPVSADEGARRFKFFERFPNLNEYQEPRGEYKYNADCVSLLQNCMNESWAMLNVRPRTSLKEPVNYGPIRDKINEFLGNYPQ